MLICHPDVLWQRARHTRNVLISLPHFFNWLSSLARVHESLKNVMPAMNGWWCNKWHKQVGALVKPVNHWFSCWDTWLNISIVCSVVRIKLSYFKLHNFWHVFGLALISWLSKSISIFVEGFPPKTLSKYRHSKSTMSLQSSWSSLAHCLQSFLIVFDWSSGTTVNASQTSTCSS